MQVRRGNVESDDYAGGPPTESCVPPRAELRVVAILFHSGPLTSKVGAIRTVRCAFRVAVAPRSRLLRIIQRREVGTVGIRFIEKCQMGNISYNNQSFANYLF